MDWTCQGWQQWDLDQAVDNLPSTETISRHLKIYSQKRNGHLFIFGCTRMGQIFHVLANPKRSRNLSWIMMEERVIHATLDCVMRNVLVKFAQVSLFWYKKVISMMSILRSITLIVFWLKCSALIPLWIIQITSILMKILKSRSLIILIWTWQKMRKKILHGNVWISPQEKVEIFKSS